MGISRRSKSSSQSSVHQSIVSNAGTTSCSAKEVFYEKEESFEVCRSERKWFISGSRSPATTAAAAAAAVASTTTKFTRATAAGQLSEYAALIWIATNAAKSHDT